jgi:hypothetical protein
VSERVDGEQLALDLAPGPPRRRRAGARSSFHVRSHVTAEEAAAGEARALGQEAAILGDFLIWGPLARVTPSELHRYFPDLPITSIRRALTNLTKRGRLIHYKADRRPGPHGAAESTWGLA